MLKQILPRATKISILFAVAFFIINYIGMEKPDILYLVEELLLQHLLSYSFVLHYFYY